MPGKKALCGASKGQTNCSKYTRPWFEINSAQGRMCFNVLARILGLNCAPIETDCQNDHNEEGNL